MAVEVTPLAVRQLQDYWTRTSGTILAEDEFELDVSTAYSVQDSITQLLIAEGEDVIGYKVGCTGPGTTAQFGMAVPI